MAYAEGYHEHWEDSYAGQVYTKFTDLLLEAETVWLGPFANLNWPVWINYDEHNEQEQPLPTVEVGVFMPRHGNCCIHIAPATPDQVTILESMMLRAWAGRADAHFLRYSSAMQGIVT